MEQTSLKIPARFCGPSDSGNGGYSAGRLASFLNGAVEVTLKRPIPLERALAVNIPGRAVLSDEQGVVAEAEAKPLTLDAVEAPPVALAREWSKHCIGFDVRNPYPYCFVCGPQRDPKDGLNIFPGKEPGGERVAAPWTPHTSLANADSRVLPEFLWSALDCPGYFAVAQGGERALLGRMHAELIAELHAGEACVVVAWPLGREGRKLFAGTALWTDTGRLIAKSRQIWIAL